jgi:transposase
MSKKRRQYSPQFKSKVALEAIQGVKTVPELSSHHSVHPSLNNQWKRHLVESASGLFETGQASKTAEELNGG